MEWLNYSPIGENVQLVLVENHDEFKIWIIGNGLPDATCFDHDQGENILTGYESAKWLVDYCLDKECLPPSWACQSANPVGNIISRDC